MKIIVKTVLSTASDGACCYLLQIGPNVSILLDCGISHKFDFSAYRRHEALIK